MAATRAWLGSTSTNGQIAANWSGGVVPIAGDSIIADGRAQRALSSGTDFGGILMVDIKFFSTYPFDLGTSSTPFEGRCSGEFLWQGQGSAWINAKGGNITKTIIDSATGKPVSLGGATGAMTRIDWKRGYGSLNHSTNIDYLFVTDAGNPAFDSDVTVNCLNGIDTLVQNSGACHLMKAVNGGSANNVLLSGGLLDIAQDDGSSGLGMDTLWQSGGTLAFRSTSTSYQITTHYFAAGSLVVENSQATLHYIGTQYLMPGAYFPDDGQGLITIGTQHRIGAP